MDNYARLLKKLQDEKKQLTVDFLQLEPEEMKRSALEFGIKEDMYVNFLVKYTRLNERQRAFLLQEGSIASKLYQPWLNEGLGKEASFLEKPVIRQVLEEKLAPEERLLARASTEWEVLEEKLLMLMPKEIIARAGEIAVKEDTLYFLEYNLSSFSEKEVAALNRVAQPLEAVWQEYVNGSYSLCDTLQQALEHVAYEELKRQMTQQFLGNPIQFSVLRLYRDEGTECMEQSKLIRTVFLSQRPEVDADFAVVTEDLHLSGEERLGFSINTYVAKEQNEKPAHPATVEELQFLKSVFASLSADGKLQLVEAEYFKSKVVVIEEENPREDDEEMELGD